MSHRIATIIVNAQLSVIENPFGVANL